MSEEYKRRKSQGVSDEDLVRMYTQNYNPGFIESTATNLLSGLEGMGGGVLRGGGEIANGLGFENVAEKLDNIGTTLEDSAADLGVKYGTRDKYSNMGILDRLTSLDYLTDPRGLTSSVMNGLGSSLPFLAITAVTPELTLPGLVARSAASKLLGNAGANWVARKGIDKFLFNQ